jgi:CheY-like chemotaxis protein
MKGDEEKFLKEGFDGYVPKPIEMAVLIKELNRCLGV